MTTKRRLEDYPRVAVVQRMTCDGIAWLVPHALVADRYVHPLPDDECVEFGVKFSILLERKIPGVELSLGDAFTTVHPDDLHTKPLDQIAIIGDYKQVEPL